MNVPVDASPHSEAERLALQFLSRVWAPPHDLGAIDELMTEDFVITSGGNDVNGREAFKAWGGSDRGDGIESQRGFGLRLGERGFEKVKLSGKIRWLGLALHTPGDGKVE